MTTARDVITRSLRLIGVTAHDEDPTGDETNNALNDLNTMIHGWKAMGVDVTHTNYSLDSATALGDEFDEGLIFLLAARLAPSYSVPVSFDAESWFRALQNKYITVSNQTIDSGLLRLPSSYWGASGYREWQ